MPDFTLPGRNGVWPIESFEKGAINPNRMFEENKQMLDTLNTILDWTRRISGPSSHDTHKRGQGIAPRSRLCGEFASVLTSIRDQVERINKEVEERGLGG